MNVVPVKVDKDKIYQKARYLLERGYIEEDDLKETVKRMILKERELINSKDKGAVLPTHTPSKQ
jgi:hypothetical protein